jgi:predicted Zn-dependent protease
MLIIFFIFRLPSVLTGMFKYARTEDEIGGILGHEMAHNLARHQGEKISSTAVVGLLARLTLFLDPTGGYLMIFLPTMKLFSELPNSRYQETEADNIGMYLAAKACYDPEALGRVFKRMDDAGNNGSDPNLALKPPEFLSTHPSDNTRINNMKKWLPRDNMIFHQEDGHRCQALRRQIDAGNAIFYGATRSTRPEGLPGGFNERR